MRRLLLFTTDLEIGGTPTVVRELAIRLRPFAHVEVACLKGDGPTGEPIRAAGVTVTPLDVKSVIELPAAIRALVNVIDANRIDTVLSFLVHANLVAARAARRRPGVRFFQSIQTTQPNPAWHWWVQKRIAKDVAAFIVPSHAVAEVAELRSGIARDRCVIIPNGVDVDHFAAVERSSSDVFRVGFVGRLDPIKHVEDAIAAMPLLGDGYSLNIFGEGREGANLERLAAGRSNIRFHGETCDPAAAYGQIDCLVLPSRGEGFGLVLLEAMAAGVPVVACAMGGVIDVVEDGVTGLLYPPTAPAAVAIAERVAVLLKDQSLYARLAAAGSEKAREAYTWSAVIPRYVASLGLAEPD